MSLHADKPQAGFYKYRRNKDSKWEPVAIWIKDGEIVCRVGDRMEDAHAIWTWVADKRVSKEAAQFAFKSGHFADEPPPIGHNAPNIQDPFEAHKHATDAKREQAEQWLGSRPVITTQADADYAVNAHRELTALIKRGDEFFKTEKAPILEDARVCDDKHSYRKVVAAVAERLRGVYGRFMAAEEARLKAEAARKVKAAEAAAKAKLENDPVAALTDPPQLSLLPEEPIKIQAGGGIGRRAGLKTVWVPTVNDYIAAAGYFLEHPDFKAAIDKLVKHAVRDSKGTLQIPGVTVTETREAA